MKFQGQYKWLVTGAAGFIGSHVIDELLSNNQIVIGIDNLSTGFDSNIESVLKLKNKEVVKNWTFYNEDIRELDKIEKYFYDCDFVIHLAALASVPMSIDNPIEVHSVNVNGQLNVLECAKRSKIKRLVYASSSAVYGDDSHDEKIEDKTGRLLSPYAASKFCNELNAEQYFIHYQLNTIGFRYFNVFGSRQDPNGAYAAVIPKWLDSLKRDQPLVIFGDGSTTRDFCFVKDVSRINIQACLNNRIECGQVYNVSTGQTVSLSKLADYLLKLWKEKYPTCKSKIHFEPFRPGDIHKSCGDNRKLTNAFGELPMVSLKDGLRELIQSI